MLPVVVPMGSRSHLFTKKLQTSGQILICPDHFAANSPRMEPIEPRGGDLTAGETVIVESDPNKIGRRIIRLDPDVFAPTVNDGAKLAD